jgi:hypothetical protein
MTVSSEFWLWFDAEARPHLGLRAQTFSRIFRYIDRFENPVIIETGSVRRDEWGEGRSTVLFSRYAQARNGWFMSIDQDPNTVALARSLAPRSYVWEGDSVAALARVALTCPAANLIYLDSYDIDFANPLPSATHHLKEFAAAMPMVRRDTLVVVDDSPRDDAGRIGGKGKLIGELAEAAGASLVFSEYQTAWTGFGR